MDALVRVDYVHGRIDWLSDFSMANDFPPYREVVGSVVWGRAIYDTDVPASASVCSSLDSLFYIGGGVLFIPRKDKALPPTSDIIIISRFIFAQVSPACR